MRKTILFSLATLAGLLGAALAEPTADGLYAHMQTSMGDFYFQLYYQQTPRTVANFVSLAEGGRDWLDPRSGQVKNDPYYKGIIFHRVIEDFMIQCGSPRGDGTDGPGYRFSDEFDPSLRHDRPGTVSMANSGPNTNGGQIFITTTNNAAWLDDVHSVFGRVVEGMNVVSNIAAVAVDGSRPLEPVSINRVDILRRGTEAEAWDPAAVTPPLPVVRPKVGELYREGATWLLDWTESANSTYWIYGTGDLSNPQGWQQLTNGEVQWGSADVTVIFDNNPFCVFNVSEVEYFE